MTVIDRASADPKQLRNALGSYPTGVTIMTTHRADGAPVGLTVNSFASVSLDPPLVLWSLAAQSPSLEAFRAAPHFCVNLLAAEQTELCRRFASPIPDKFDGVGWATGLHGVPVLEGCVANFECSTAFSNWGGDHVIFVGRVERFEVLERQALMFHKGRLGPAPEF